MMRIPPEHMWSSKNDIFVIPAELLEAKFGRLAAEGSGGLLLAARYAAVKQICRTAQAKREP